MSATELPPLPEPAIFDPGRFGVGYSPAQMTAYALQANVDLAAESERNRVDAERYRWLRSRPLCDDDAYIAVDSARVSGRWALGGPEVDGDSFSGQRGCDAAIDLLRGAVRAALKDSP